MFFSQSVLCFSPARIQIRKYSGTKQTINFKWPNTFVGCFKQRIDFLPVMKRKIQSFCHVFGLRWAFGTLWELSMSFFKCRKKYSFSGDEKSTSDVKKFLEAINKSGELSHPHVLGWVGISRIHGKYVTISQYMSNGGLRDYLLKQTEQASLCQYPLYDPYNLPS